MGSNRIRGEAVKTLIMRFLRDGTGATAIEYAIIAGGLSIVILVAVQSIGTSLNTTFTSVSTAVK
jgi:pilus assembly protein Flp/PilA